MASKAQASTWVLHRLEELRGLSFARLSNLPTCAEESMFPGEDTAKAYIHCDLQPDGQLRIMVEAIYYTGLWGLWYCKHLDGFLISPQDELSKVPEEMTWEF